MQAKLLRVLETQSFIRLGDTRPTQANVHIVAATNRNLRREADASHFRPDLYYRLSVFTAAVPPLKDRAADIGPLAAHFLQYFAAKQRKHLPALAPDALLVLQRHDWPGNVRELKNVLEHAAILTPTGSPWAPPSCPLSGAGCPRPLPPAPTLPTSA